MYCNRMFLYMNVFPYSASLPCLRCICLRHTSGFVQVQSHRLHLITFFSCAFRMCEWQPPLDPNYSESTQTYVSGHFVMY